MISLTIKMAKIILRILAVIVIGFISALICSVVVINLGFAFAPDFILNGMEGYEATGPIGFVLGALIGLVGSSVFLFRKRMKG